MADQEATLYYVSKQVFNFKKIYEYFIKSNLFIKNPETQLITYTNGVNYFTEANQEKLKDLILGKTELGVKLWLNNEVYVFWSFVQKDNYFLQNFGLYYLDDLSMEKVSRILIGYALNELAEINRGIIGFIIDQYGQTSDYDFAPFLVGRKETLKYHDSPDVLFLPKDKLSQIILDDRFEIVPLNQKFTCVAKNLDLLNFTKSLLSKE